jgi:hypothetical protein
VRARRAGTSTGHLVGGATDAAGADLEAGVSVLIDASSVSSGSLPVRSAMIASAS